MAAAAELLRTQGMAGCTARAIAEESGLSKSTIHYYFEEIDELTDLAWNRLMGQFVDRMVQAAEREADPVAAVWAAAEAYVVLGSGRNGRIPMMAFDFLVASSRRGDTAAAAAVMDQITTLMHRLVAATGVSEPAARASALVSTLIGTVVRAEIHPRDPHTALAEAAVAIGLPLPEQGSWGRSSPVARRTQAVGAAGADGTSASAN